MMKLRKSKLAVLFDATIVYHILWVISVALSPSNLFDVVYLFEYFNLLNLIPWVSAQAEWQILFTANLVLGLVGYTTRKVMIWRTYLYIHLVVAVLHFFAYLASGAATAIPFIWVLCHSASTSQFHLPPRLNTRGKE